MRAAASAASNSIVAFQAISTTSIPSHAAARGVPPGAGCAGLGCQRRQRASRCAGPFCSSRSPSVAGACAGVLQTAGRRRKQQLLHAAIASSLPSAPAAVCSCCRRASCRRWAAAGAWQRTRGRTWCCSSSRPGQARCCRCACEAAAAAAAPAFLTATAAHTHHHHLLLPLRIVQVQQPLQQLAGGLAAAAAAHLRGSGWHSGQQPQQQQQWLQWQQRRGLLGVVRHKNYQDHNKQRPPKYKIKTPS